MNARLFNILSKFQGTFDLLTQEGPGALRRIAQVMHQIEEGTLRAAELLEQIGGGNIPAFAGPEDQGHIDALAALRDRCGELAGDVRELEGEPAAAMFARRPAGAAGVVGAGNPILRKVLALALKLLLDDLLSVVQPAPQQTAPPQRHARPSEPLSKEGAAGRFNRGDDPGQQ